MKNYITKLANFIWYGNSLFGKLVSYLLWPFSLLYCGLIGVRRWLYRCGMLKKSSFAVLVIVVGNITVGGTGKTPLVIWLINFLKEKGYKPGVVSRGYGRKTRGIKVVDGFSSKAEEVGDEPLLIVKWASCPMVVGEDRVLAVKKLLEISGCNVVISDDGLQHYALARDLEMVVVDGERKLGNGMCLPAGPLRQSACFLKNADFVIENKNKHSSALSEMATKEWRTIHDDGYYMELAPKRFCKVKDANCQLGLNIDAWRDKGKKIHAVAGIGNPQRFFRMLRALGLQIQEHVFSDHYQYALSDFAFVSKLTDDVGDEIIIMTEKDAIKCKNFAKENWWYLEVAAKVDEKFAQDFWIALHSLEKAKLL